MEIHLVNVDDVDIPPRFRKDPSIGLDELITSIKARGLYQPIIVERSTNKLIAGRRRLGAFFRLKEEGHTEFQMIPAIYKDEIDELTAREIELEENICREDF